MTQTLQRLPPEGVHHCPIKQAFSRQSTVFICKFFPDWFTTAAAAAGYWVLMMRCHGNVTGWWDLSLITFIVDFTSIHTASNARAVSLCLTLSLSFSVDLCMRGWFLLMLSDRQQTRAPRTVLGSIWNTRFQSNTLNTEMYFVFKINFNVYILYFISNISYCDYSIF